MSRKCANDCMYGSTYVFMYVCAVNWKLVTETKSKVMTSNDPTFIKSSLTPFYSATQMPHRAHFRLVVLRAACNPQREHDPLTLI